MSLIIHYIFVFIFVSSFFIGISKCELEAILSNSRLPEPTNSIRSTYDGDDSIYIFGGLTESGSTNRIQRYKISSDTISLPITSFPTGRYGGGLSSDSAGNIFYYGGISETTVYKFDPTNSNLSEVATLEDNFVYGSTVTHPDSLDIAYLIGGTMNTVQCFNMSSASSCERFESLWGFQFNSGFVLSEKAFVFGRQTTGEILVLDLKSLQSQIVSTELPDFYWEPSVVTDGKYGYLIGGFTDSSSTPIDSLIRFDPETLQVELIHVKNHPGVGISRRFQFPSTVYVEKLNRIYIFGGRTWTGSAYANHDEIWYIDLPTPVSTITSPTTATPPATITRTITTSTEITESATWIPTSATLNSDIFNCEGKPNGIYPHPSNYVSYINCYEGEIILYECSPPLVFHPERERCDFPQGLNCDTS